ncbi:metalloprotease [Methylobacterium radiodurans]|uniref:Metalloprotease n=1 Tax=Methylobacterium radiodurans TaxID=2202828 RepID=A0A2U8VPY3_9HYPH|nr:metalloprotease [Methylobacterium radiodurans]
MDGSLSSGDKGFDRALAKTLVRLSDLFEVLPGFAFQELDEENAYATSHDKFGNRDDGTVIFGRSLYKSIMNRPENPHICVAAVCAHEFAHILQFKTGIRQRLVGPDNRVKKLELHADFLAGYFAGIRKKESRDFPAAAFASMQHSIGDNSFGSVQHHGTAEERGAAVVAGFSSAFHMRQTLSEAIEAGISYVKRG